MPSDRAKFIAAIINGHPKAVSARSSSLVDKCAGCSWQGWHHHEHLGELIDNMLTERA